MDWNFAIDGIQYAGFFDGLAETLGSAISGAASGGVFGIVGSALGLVGKYFQEKQRQSWEREKWNHEEKLIELNMKAGAAETENEVRLATTEGSWSGLGESIRAESKVTDVHKWVNDIRALFRPAVTIVMWVVATIFFFQIIKGNVDFLDPNDQIELVRYMTFTTFFCASAALLWWFGDRAFTPPGMKNR